MDSLPPPPPDADAPAPAPAPRPTEVRRVSYAEHAREAARREHPHDPEAAGRAAAGATRLQPLQDIQTALDQLYTHARARLRGEPWDHSGPGYPQYAKDTLDHCRKLASTLVVAADAAMSMIGQQQHHLKQLEDAMSAEDPNAPPKLTPSGAPHPLQAGGYDPDADPQLAGNESDIATGKAGDTTRAQAEAIGRADAMAAEEKAGAEKAAAERGKVQTHAIPPRKEPPPPPPPEKGGPRK